MADDFWAITTYFNPMHWQRRLANCHAFRKHLGVPLVAVEIGYDGQYDLQPGDADILIQIPGVDVMWQKERLFNVALRYVPPAVERVACLDCDVVLGNPAVWRDAARALEWQPIVQMFSEVHYLPRDVSVESVLPEAVEKSAPGFGWLRRHGNTPWSLCNPSWINPNDPPPVTYGLAWAFRRELFAKRGFYDAWVVGGGTRVHFFAAHGHFHEAAAAFKYSQPMSEHYCQWANDFYSAVRGCWGCVPGTIAHLWHGDMGPRKHRQRYAEFVQFQFDPTKDLAADRHGAWRWNSDKLEMHDYIRQYIAGRQEDGVSRLDEAPAAAARSAAMQRAAA